MGMLNDLIYIASIVNSEDRVLQEIYKEAPEQIESDIRLIFDYDIQKKLLGVIGKEIAYEPKLITPIMHDYLNTLIPYLNENISPETITYLKEKRNISTENIKEFRIGDFSSLFKESKLIIPPDLKEKNLLFLKSYLGDEEKKKAALNVVLEMTKCIRVFHENSIKLFKGAHGIVFPSYYRNNCKGFIVKNVEYIETVGQHIYKFINPFSATYIFNKDAVDNYESLYLVESVTDAIALINNGYRNTISMSMTRLSDYQREVLANKTLTVIFDKDFGGYRGVLKIMKDRNNEKDKYCLMPVKQDFDEIADKFKFINIVNDISRYDIREESMKNTIEEIQAKAKEKGYIK